MTAQPIEEAAAILGRRARRDVPIGPLTTYRVGGPAALFMVAHEEEDLAVARQAVGATSIPVLVVGRGSNLLVADAGFAGLAVSLGEEFATIEPRGDSRVRAGGAAQLPVLARRTAALGLTGLEWAVGVPGSVGGAIRMNAGGHGSDTAASLRRFCFLDLRGEDHDGEAGVERLAFGYRRSSVAPHHVVLWGEFALDPGDPDAAQATITEIVRWRREHQPGGQNAGSVFANPPDDSAGRLIEEAGLKGLRRGSAQVSRKHANFIQADDGGAANDVWALMAEVKRRVFESSGISLGTEVRLVGFDQASTSYGASGS